MPPSVRQPAFEFGMLRHREKLPRQIFRVAAVPVARHGEKRGGRQNQRQQQPLGGVGGETCARNKNSTSVTISTISAGQPQSSQNRPTRKASIQQPHISQNAGLRANGTAAGFVKNRSSTSAPTMTTARMSPANGWNSVTSVRLVACWPNAVHHHRHRLRKIIRRMPRQQRGQSRARQPRARQQQRPAKFPGKKNAATGSSHRYQTP